MEQLSEAAIVIQKVCELKAHKALVVQQHYNLIAQATIAVHMAQAALVVQQYIDLFTQAAIAIKNMLLIAQAAIVRQEGIVVQKVGVNDSSCCKVLFTS